MNKDGLPEQGDVITSQVFVYGTYRHGDRNGVIEPGGTDKTIIRKEKIGEDERVQMALHTGKLPPKSRSFDDSAYDPTRATAKFVVIGARMQGGSDGREYHADGWHVTARRLNDDGKYNPDGELLEFYMSSGFSVSILPEKIEIIGKMTPTFV